MTATGPGPGTQPAPAPAPQRQALFRELYQRAGATHWGLAEEEFARLLLEIGGKYLPAGATHARTEEFYRGLHVEELALARACAAGSEAAWETFLNRYREKLYDAARGITREDASARELADSLYADLYGINTRGGQRVSKLAYYNGRGSLEGWLRTTLAQEHINTIRKRRKLVSLDEKTDAGQQFPAADPPAEPPPDPRLVEATDDALASLTSEERFILASYHLDGRTLAEIARSLAVHESTVSRKLDKITGKLKDEIISGLLRRGMKKEQALETLQSDVRDVAVDVRARLLQDGRKSPFLGEGNR